jgi:nucleoside-diphosphate-sugar epimerase
MPVAGSRHLVVGAGSVGSAVAGLLAADGVEVVVLTRSGAGPDRPGIERVRGDAAEAATVAAAAHGAAAIYNCVNPPYHRWVQLWPPIAAALLAAAESTGAVLATASNLYPYGHVREPIREGQPDRPAGAKARVRAAMTAEALARHRAGRIRAVEVRASDYLGAGDQSVLDRVLPRALAGRPVRVIGAPDQPHSWTWAPDVARTLVATVDYEPALGRVWHALTNPPRTQREAVADHCRAAGVPPVRVRALPHLALRAAGLVSPVVRELEETRYQFVRPFVLDSRATERELGLAPTDWDDVCRANVELVRARSAG